MHVAPQLAPAVMSRMENHYYELSSQNLCGLIWAGAVLEELAPSAFEAATQLLAERHLQDFTARVSYIKLSGPRPGLHLGVFLHTMISQLMRHASCKGSSQ